MKQKTFNAIQRIAHDYLDDFCIDTNDQGKTAFFHEGEEFRPHKNIKQAIRLAGYYNLQLYMNRVNSHVGSGQYACASSSLRTAEVLLDSALDLDVAFEQALCKAIVSCINETLIDYEEDLQ